jgi:hypothetical protein
MTNPTIPWQLQQLDPDTDAPRLMQDFEAIQDWLLTEAIHRHHMQFASFDIPALAAGASADVTGITFVQQFAGGVTPFVYVQQNSSSGPVAGVVQIVFYPNNITNVGCDVRCNNPGGTAASAAPGGGKLMACDPTFDVSL